MLLCGKGDNGTVYVIYEFNFNSQYSRQNTNIIKEHKIVMRVCAGPVTRTNYDIKCFIKL